METKHTPGPWFVAGTGLSRYVEGRVRPGMLQEVAWCGATEVPEQMDANARLIAAAPDLLECLQQAIRELEGYELDATGEGYNNPVFNAVLAKATGEQA